MTTLKREGAQRLAKIARRPDLPPWWQPLSYVLLAGFAFYLGVVALSAPDPTPIAPELRALLSQDGGVASPSPFVPSPADPAGPPTSDLPTPDLPTSDVVPGDVTAPVQPAPAVGDIVVATVQGDSLAVPAAAYDTARAAALALFTGVFDQVPTAAGATLPSGLPRYPDPVVGTTVLELAETDRLVFSTLIDPDGAGPEATRPVTVSVVSERGSWRFAGFGF
jgi:hypothetical protein